MSNKEKIIQMSSREFTIGCDDKTSDDSPPPISAKMTTVIKMKNMDILIN